MKTVGIIAEYNPFHKGHQYHIGEARRLTCADAVLVVMSASFVQRGEPACADKFTRARWAVEGGADMVIELPDVFALSCAERFASGAVRILKGAGIVDSLCFGSESGDVSYLEEAADNFPSQEAFEKAIASGSSYPKALAEASGSPLSPNDILGVEYVRAVKKYGCGFGLCAVKREGGYGDSELGGEFSSALAIRNALSQVGGSARMSPAVFDGLCRALPRGVLEDISGLIKAGAFPSTADGLSDALLYRLRSMTKEEIAGLPEVSEGLENLFSKYALECGDFSELMSRVKSKRYTMARLKRTAMCALLGLTRELSDEAASNDAALYARVLAVKKGSGALLSELCEKASIPLILRSADREKLPPLGAEVERISALAHSIHALGKPYEKGAAPDGSFRLIEV